MPAEPQVYISYSFVNESAGALGTRVKITQTPLTTTDEARNWVTYTSAHNNTYVGGFAIDEVSIFNKALTAEQILGFKQAAIG